MNQNSNKVVSLSAYRCAGTGLNAFDEATIRYVTRRSPELIEIEGMRFSDLGQWLVEQTRVRDTMMVQARIRFSGNARGRVELLTLGTRPASSMFDAMPFEVSSTKGSTAMLHAYDYMVGQNRYPADTIIAVFQDGWVALESADAYHGTLPKQAYEATADWPA
ncbi:hypothetical protein SADO_06337 [Salinisphaera dokdonensis CL-ES53]|uniref:Uncharacterized protein n=1 Tax=Salinisphaera dokdonensis CL-ES53 TaxID=1304272 RepID=A0ABV2AYY1_9GAMM